MTEEGFDNNAKADKEPVIIQQKYAPWYKKVLTKRFARRFARQTERAIRFTLKGFGQEAIETKVMAQAFFSLLESKLDMEKRSKPPTPEEVKEAIEQLKDVARISIFATISLLPGGGFSLIGLELLARKFGIKSFTFIPSSFRKKKRRLSKKSMVSIEKPPISPKEMKK